VTYGGDEMSIGFNVGYVLDVLNVVDTETVVLAVTDPNSSAIMTNKGQDNNRYVIMPMRL
jgi:DNA polymerase-3 subunit beta